MSQLYGSYRHLQIQARAPVSFARCSSGRRPGAPRLLLVLLLGLAGCNLVLEYEPPRQPDAAPQQQADQGPDLEGSSEGLAALDLGADLGLDLLQLCSSGGITADCDPLNPDDPSACAEGQCYLVKQGNSGGISPACVCPQGTLGKDAECQTTAECVPGLVCAEVDYPNGRCRPLCAPDADGDKDVCEGDQSCVQIIGKEDLGYCAACSDLGHSMSCDPMHDQGCTDGSCYILLAAGSFYRHETRCICPIGRLVENDRCSTTRACQPGLVCAADSRTCRPLCIRPEDCPSDASCQLFALGYGYCHKQW